MRGMLAMALVLLAGLWGGFPGARAQGRSCGIYMKPLRQAMKRGDLATAARQLEAAQGSHACSGEQLARMGRMAAYAAMRAAFEPGVRGQAREDLLRRGLQLGRPWQLLAALGDILEARKEHAAAARYYQEALDDINDAQLNPRPPKRAVIGSIYRKAMIARKLARGFVPTTRGRSGEPGGLARLATRGFVVRKTVVPIAFKTGSVAFTADGAKAAADMLDFLNRQGAPDITLVGHTDERGPKGYNMRLSLARAKAVREWMKARGYEGKIRVEGRGEEEPFDLGDEDPSDYTREEIWQLNRRVELKLDDEG